ncbi:Predicted lactoylglutathione lyase [Micromonospora mirobrigensis]|uniref:Predicted lactoylglutathione lyase n=1 Tax=Micromonospora mirobrigensis TaxID=262898 RepID=A0A1C4UE62_9ACTN|nr:VOC family protein [Micromonospora mirobrigensis]SCE69937.1 Predicted lactoylglutathione lyase [Micromonospora mirobrigensis]
MLDHFSVPVRDLPVAAAFYDAVLAPLGARRLMEPGPIGYGVDRPDFWLEPTAEGATPVPAHIAFTAPDRAAVHAFHDAAIAAGAEVLHAPKVWPEYHPGYYGAFVRDPDGNNVEAVCHRPA